MNQIDRGRADPASATARRLAGAIAALAVMSLVAQAVYLAGLRGSSVLRTILEMLRFFTILTNGLAAIAMGIAATSRDPGRPQWLYATVALSLAYLSVVYYLVLAGDRHPVGIGVWADIGLHAVVPALTLYWWARHAPKAGLGVRVLPLMAAWPVGYVCLTLALGAIDGVYPYPFLDLGRLGPWGIVRSLAGLTAGFLGGGAVLIWLSRILPR